MRINNPAVINSAAIVTAVWASITKKLTHWNVIHATASDNMRQEDAAFQSTTEIAYTKLKELTTPIIGGIRVNFSIKTTDVAKAAYGKIYKNGISIGIERNTSSTSYVPFTEDLSFSAGDTIEIWIHGTSGGFAYVQDFSINYDYASEEIVL